MFCPALLAFSDLFSLGPSLSAASEREPFCPPAEDRCFNNVSWWPHVVQVGRDLWIPGESGLYSKTLCQTRPKNSKKPQTKTALVPLAWGAGHVPSHVLVIGGPDEDLLPSVVSKCRGCQNRWLLSLVHGLNFLGPSPNPLLTSQLFWFWSHLR